MRVLDLILDQKQIVTALLGAVGAGRLASHSDWFHLVISPHGVTGMVPAHPPTRPRSTGDEE